MGSTDPTRGCGRAAVAGALLTTALSVAACTSAPHPGRDGGVTSHSTTVDGIERTWTVYTPAREGAASRPMPVVLVIHGTGDTGDGIRSGIGPDLEETADRENVVVAYVDGHRNNWNECRTAGDWPAKASNLDDVGLMRTVVEDIHRDLGPDTVDVDRTFAIGFSSGGSMAQRLAFEAPDLVSGIASVNANIPVDDNLACTDSGEPVPVIFIQGREDPMNPFDGGEVVVGAGPSAESRGEVRSARDSAGWFASRNGWPVGRTPATVRDGDAEITTWDGDHPVRLIAVEHSGHSFPTATGRWGNDGGARFDGPGAIWEFFAGLDR